MNLSIETSQPTPVFARTWTTVPRTPGEPESLIDPAQIQLVRAVGGHSGGTVFRARYNGAAVAAKLLSACESLPHEARLLRHPNLVTIYGRSQHATGPVLIMEYVAGGNLRQWIESHPIMSTLPFTASHTQTATRVGLALQIANGMACLHSHRIVHRDLKPENILLAPIDEEDMTVKICDFGLSRELDNESGHAMTSTNGVKGTPVYMSPEQWRRGAVTDKADVYAYGLVLIELFSGEPVEFENCKCKLPCRSLLFVYRLVLVRVYVHPACTFISLNALFFHFRSS